LAQLIDIMSDSPLDNSDGSAASECDRDIVQDVLQVQLVAIASFLAPILCQLLMARPPRFASDSRLFLVD
jgi:hypothetical protein